MNSFATYNDLARFGRGTDRVQILRFAASSEGKNVFLSHSSADNAHLPGVMSVLRNHGGRVYIDCQDGRLPVVPSQETAEILRNAVAACPRFVLFVTPNSGDSVWIPWELGLADGKRGLESVTLFPAAQLSIEQAWAETEYLGLYRRIVWGPFSSDPKPQWFVLDHRRNTGKPLAKWISEGW